jgi:lipopolysaccharide transport system ATP-binding protein
MTAAIRVENISKKYILQHQVGGRSRYVALRDVLAQKFNSIFRRGSGPDASREEFWALKDVSFEIKQGEAVGIIGRNGAGKSTLLKILSRITKPTKGRIEIEGRVASLLEVGTGFHPELTGRENIFLNGAILGMHRAEIKKKFDEIVAFAEVEKFLDTPVKHYSSGMYMRLAFAVAAHLEPEILIVDEVLAVGDAQFQKKCLGKMQDVSTKEGRTVIFVSHNMQAVVQLCSSAILLSKGHIAQEGKIEKVIEHYLSSQQVAAGEMSWELEKAPGTDVAKLRSVKALNEEENICNDFDLTEPVKIKIEFWILKKTSMTVSVHLYNSRGVNLFASANWTDPIWGQNIYNPGLYSCECVIPANYLNEGKHLVKIYLTRDNNACIVDVEIEDVISFVMFDSGKMRKGFSGTWLGLVRPLLPWSGKYISPITSNDSKPS